MSTTPASCAVLAARRRTDGAVVYLDFEGDWNEHLSAAVIARVADERRALADRAAFEAQRPAILTPHLMELADADGRRASRTAPRSGEALERAHATAA
jgi:hypothetical protein